MLNVGVQGVIELLVDLKDVLDLVEDGLDLLVGQDRLGCGGGSLEWSHGLRK